MNYSKEYMDFLEGHRRSIEFKDKLKQATLEATRLKLEEEVKKTMNS